MAELRRAPLAELITAQQVEEEALAALAARRAEDELPDHVYDEMEVAFCELGQRVTLRQVVIDRVLGRRAGVQQAA